MFLFVLIRLALWSFNAFTEIFFIPIHLIRCFKKPKKCKSIEDHILLHTASKLTEKIRNKNISCVAVIKAYISRVAEVNCVVNALLEDRFKEALEEAEKVDDFFKETALSEEELAEQFPLLGVPLSVKGSIAVAGMRHSGGRVDRAVKAEVDATVVKNAKKAGAIVLLISNVPELCMSLETTNKIIGRTRNPFNSCRTAGGCSGGEASLLDAGASLIGLGSDIGGSLRLPAHCCGVWGHKRSPHAVSNFGHYPDCGNKQDWNDFLTLGPMARYATDLKLLLNVIAEPEMKDVLKLTKEVDVKHLNFFYMEDVNSSLYNSLQKDVIRAISQVTNHLNIVSINSCTKVELPLMEYCTELSYFRLLFIDEVENLFKGEGEGAYEELLRFLLGKSIHEFTSIFYGLLRRNIGSFPEQAIKTVKKHLVELRTDLIKLLGQDGVLILATSPAEATFHGDVFRKVFNAGYCSIFNAIGFPATNCFVRMSRNGLPIGVQMVAAPNFDRLTLSVAEEIERAFGGWNHANFA